MTEGMSTLLLLGAEFGLILIVIFMVLLVNFIRRRSTDKRYVEEFISDNKNQQAKTREAVKKSLKEDSHLLDEELENHLDEMSGSEKKLYKRILNMYLGFDRKCLSGIREELLVINNSWMGAMRQSIEHAAEAHMNEAGNISSEKVAELNEKIDGLTADNVKIAAELVEAMETMDEIVKEYSLMYAGQENPTMDRLSGDYDKLKQKSDSHNDESDSNNETGKE